MVPIQWYLKQFKLSSLHILLSLATVNYRCSLLTKLASNSYIYHWKDYACV